MAPWSPGSRTRVAALAVVAVLAAAGVASGVGHTGQTFSRTYEATSAVGFGGAGPTGAFSGFAVCNNDQDTFFDTAACVRYRQSGSTGWDYRGWEFEVRVQDLAFGTDGWYLIAIDTVGSSSVDCTPSGPSVCILAKGTARATIPASAQGEILRVFPLTYHGSGPVCCPDSAATRGQITITFPAPP